MADTTFTDGSTVIYASWLQPINDAVYKGYLTQATEYTVGSDPFGQLVLYGTPNFLASTRPLIASNGTQDNVSLNIGMKGTATGNFIRFYSDVYGAPKTEFRIGGGGTGDFLSLSNTAGASTFTAAASVSTNVDIVFTPKGSGYTKSTRSLSVTTTGQGLRIAEGSNAKQGVVTLVSGTVVVSNSTVTAASRIFLTSQADGGTPGWLRVSTRSVGTSFTITSSSALDTSTVAYQIFEPA